MPLPKGLVFATDLVIVPNIMKCSPFNTPVSHMAESYQQYNDRSAGTNPHPGDTIDKANRFVSLMKYTMTVWSFIA